MTAGRQDRTSSPFRWKFTDKEDAVLRQVVTTLGPTDWAAIAMYLPGRNARQCRERWKHYLSSTETDKPWTPQEERQLFDKVSEIGPKWTRVAASLGNRTDIEVKVHWMKTFNDSHPLLPRGKRAGSADGGSPDDGPGRDEQEPDLPLPIDSFTWDETRRLQWEGAADPVDWGLESWPLLGGDRAKDNYP
jgi:hypothetical protein